MKNTDGALGPICHYCGGYGFTNTMEARRSASCPHCLGSGVDKDAVLQRRLASIEARIGAVEQR
jgi:hypothetical protein